MMPVLGSRPATGLALARELFRNAYFLRGGFYLSPMALNASISDFRDAPFHPLLELHRRAPIPTTAG